ncbi:hypothetical protein AVEN_166018-1 [Araneus ventricosus]|uniref:Uncharacterized protein n=1 Tax=Araneus ventricosus TaxID=182803 RepID=A0A4Y2L4G0_ARAVE|nr:hypothetical protein AVEN_166018-1 [Araneus ventricosus]
MTSFLIKSSTRAKLNPRLRSSLLNTCFLRLFPVLLRSTVQGTWLLEAPMYAPPPASLTDKMNPIQLIDKILLAMLDSVLVKNE